MSKNPFFCDYHYFQVPPSIALSSDVFPFLVYPLPYPPLPPLGKGLDDLQKDLADKIAQVTRLTAQ